MTSILLALVLVAQTSQGSSTFLSEVRELIAAQGPKGALSTLFGDNARWEAVLGAVATGKKEWLSVAAQLRPASDAHATETLNMAIQEALPHNSVAVLELVASGIFSAHEACGMYGFGQIQDGRPEPRVPPAHRHCEGAVAARHVHQPPGLVDRHQRCVGLVLET